MAFVAFAVVVSVLSGWRLYAARSEAAALQAETEATRARIESARAGHRSCGEPRAADRDETRFATPSIVLIDKLSAAIPTNTYLTALSMEDGEVRIGGLTRRRAGADRHPGGGPISSPMCASWRRPCAGKRDARPLRDRRGGRAGARLRIDAHGSPPQPTERIAIAGRRDVAPACTARLDRVEPRRGVGGEGRRPHAGADAGIASTAAVGA